MKRSFEDMSCPANMQQTPPRTPEQAQAIHGNNQQQAPLQGGNLVIGNNPQTPEHAHANAGDNQFHTPIHFPIHGTPNGVANLVLTPVFQYHTPEGTPNNNANAHAGMAAFYAQNGIILMGQQHQGGAVVINSPHNDDLNIVEVMQGHAANDGDNEGNGNIARNLFGDDSDNEDDSNAEEESEDSNNEVNGFIIFPALALINRDDQVVIVNEANDGNIRDPFTGLPFGSLLNPDLIHGIEDMQIDNHGDTTSESEDSSKDGQEMSGQTNHDSSDGYSSDEYDLYS